MANDLLKSGMAFLADRLIDQAATEVTYQRGSDAVAIRAAFGRKSLKLDDGAGGIRLERTDLDLMVRPADLVVGGRRIEPERGDLVLIVAEDGSGAVLLYEVGAVPGAPPWEWMDSYRHMIRVHCGFVEMQEPYA